MISQGLNVFGGLVAFGLNPRVLAEFIETTVILLDGLLRSGVDLAGCLAQWSGVTASLVSAVQMGALTPDEISVATSLRMGVTLEGVVSAASEVLSGLDDSVEVSVAADQLQALKGVLKQKNSI